MKKYLKIFWLLFNNNISTEVQNRKNFVIRFFSQFIFVFVQIALVEVYFTFTNQIGNWSKPEVFVLVGLFRLIEGAFHILFHSNLLALPDDINRGELDGLLAKPVNTLFLVSLREQQWHELSTYFSGIVILFYAANLDYTYVLPIVLMFILGLIALTSIMIMVSTLSFHINRLTAIGSIWDALSKSVRFPLDVFSPKTVFFIAPFLLIVTLPSALVLGKVSMVWWLVQIGGSSVLFILAYLFWNFSLKRYSSASS